MANEASPNLFCPNCAYALDGWVEPRLAQARRESIEATLAIAKQQAFGGWQVNLYALEAAARPFKEEGRE